MDGTRAIIVTLQNDAEELVIIDSYRGIDGVFSSRARAVIFTMRIELLVDGRDHAVISTTCEHRNIHRIIDSMFPVFSDYVFRYQLELSKQRIRQ